MQWSWKSAPDLSFISLAQLETKYLLLLSLGQNVVKKMWMLHIIRYEQHNVLRYKAHRLYGRGCSHIPQIYFQELYSPVPKYLKAVLMFADTGIEFLFAHPLIRHCPKKLQANPSGTLWKSHSRFEIYVIHIDDNLLFCSDDEPVSKLIARVHIHIETSLDIQT